MKIFALKRRFCFLTALSLAQLSFGAQLPQITNQPASQTVWAGATVTFSVGVTGAGPFAYQWQLNAANLPTNFISTLAGGGVGDRGVATNANLYSPAGVAEDAAGNLYIADEGHNRIRRVGTNGVITTVAGNGTNVIAVATTIRQHGVLPKLNPPSTSFSGDGGPAINADLYEPLDVVVDGAGNLLIADSGNNRIRRVDTNGIITTVAGDGQATYAGDGEAATSASLYRPTGLALDSAGNLFIADSDNNVVRKLSVNGIISTVAGTNGYGFSGDGGAATNAALNYPYGVAVDLHSNLFIADQGNERVRKVTPGGIISTVAGTNTYGFFGDGGAGTNAALWSPAGLATDAAGNVYIADESNARIRKLGTNGIITTFAGTNSSGYIGDGLAATNASLNDPQGLTVDAKGNVFIADSYNYRVRKVGTNDVIKTVAGNGSPTYSGDGGPSVDAGMGDLGGLALDPAGNVLVCDLADGRIRKLGTNGLVTTFAGNGTFSYSGDGGQATNASLDYPTALAVDTAGNVYIADEENNRVRKVGVNGIINTIAGTNTAGFSGDSGPATKAHLSGPTGVAVDAVGNVYIADASNQRVRKVAINGVITTVAGNGAPGPYLIGTFSGDGGPATSAGLSNPSAVTVDATGNLYIADEFNYRVRKVGTNGIISTLAGNGISTYSGDGSPATNASLSLPFGVAVDGAGNVLIADGRSSRIREVGTNGIIETVAGVGTAGFSGDGGAATAAKLNYPYDVVLDAAGNLYIADASNTRVRKVTYSTMGRNLSLTNVMVANAGDYQVVVTDASGSVTSSVASFQVVTSPQAYQTLHLTNGLALSFVSQPESTNVVDCTSNLTPPIVWLAISTNVAAANGDWQYTDTNTVHYRSRYYRSLTR